MTNHKIIVWFMVISSLTACLHNDSSVANSKTISKPTSSPTSNPTWKHKAVFITEARIQEIRARITNKTEPTYSAWIELKGRCENNLSQSSSAVKEWDVPSGYDVTKEVNKQAKNPLAIDTTRAYEEALCFRLTDRKEFAAKSAQIITAWMTTLVKPNPDNANARLSMSHHFPSMIAAAELIANDSNWNETQQNQFKDFVRKLILPMNSMELKKNNHANWGMVLVLSCAAYLDDEQLFRKAENKFRELIDSQITSEGILSLEVDRSDTKDWHGGPTKGKKGLWYTNFALTATTWNAEILRINGSDLYSYKSPQGATLKAAFENAAKWSLHPETFPYYHSDGKKLLGRTFITYFEILNMIWPNKDATEYLAKLRPITSEAAFADITLTHGGLGPQ